MATEDSKQPLEPATETVSALRNQLEAKEQEVRNAHADLESMLYAISHDLKAPLRAIMTSSMILQEDFVVALGNEGIAELQRLDQSARKIKVIMEEVLKLSRLSRQPIERTSLDLVPLIRERAAAISPVLVEALKLPDSLPVYVDPEMAARIVHNLLDNSWKFQSRDRALSVRVSADGRRNVFLDNGIGWSMERAPRCLLPFERINGDEYPGLGMGLTIVKMIVMKHRGSIGVGGGPNEGAMVWFDLAGE